MGFDEVFARQVEALARAGDVLSLHSTSGESPNVIRAAQAAKTRGVTVVGFLGHSGGRLKDLSDVALIVPSDDTARIQEMHLAIEHLICRDRKSTRLNSSHVRISYAVFCLKKK